MYHNNRFYLLFVFDYINGLADSKEPLSPPFNHAFINMIIHILLFYVTIYLYNMIIKYILLPKISENVTG